MADNQQLAAALSGTIRPTPRNPVLGGVADLLGMAYKLPEMPRLGVPGMDFLAANRNKVLDLLQMGDVQKTADALSYGNAIGTGKGMTYRPKDETINAALAVAPFAGKAIRATKGLPIGGSIKFIDDVAPQVEALRLAQQRAALPVEQGGLGLLESNTAADRAKAMGFNTDAYHATNANNITKFDLGKSNRGEGVSVALTPENAQAYGKITYPLKVDQQKIFDPTNKDQLGELKSYVENLIAQQKPYDKNSLSFYPFTPKKVLENLSNTQTGAYYLENDIISKSLKDLGYSGSVGMESGQSQLKMFNPENIRSQFAAFDPFRRNAATAAIMGVAAPDLLATQKK
jgi:hypothetical protein